MEKIGTDTHFSPVKIGICPYFLSPVTDRRFPVDGKIKSRHTANGILKQAGLPKQF